MKKCPFCAEDIQDAAVVCRYCGRELADTKPIFVNPQPKQPAKKSSVNSIIGCLVVIIVLGCLALFISSLTSDTKESDISEPAKVFKPITYSVTYRVEGTASSASLTYENAQGGTEQHEVGVPWEKTYTMKPGDFAYISAQNNGDHGTIICVIKLNGKEVKRSSSSGAYSIASCSGGL